MSKCILTFRDPINLINNLTTNISGLGALDASTGKLLQDQDVNLQNQINTKNPAVESYLWNLSPSVPNNTWQGICSYPLPQGVYIAEFSVFTPNANILAIHINEGIHQQSDRGPDGNKAVICTYIWTGDKVSCAAYVNSMLSTVQLTCRLSVVKLR